MNKFLKFMSVCKYNLFRKVRSITIYNPLFMFAKNIWRFRKELWNFRTFDYDYNLKLFCRSLELTRDFLASPDAVVLNAAETAKEIDDFLKAMHSYRNHVEIGMNELGYDFSSFFADRSEEEAKKDNILLDRIHEIEEDSWERAMDILKNRMRYWWD